MGAGEIFEKRYSLDLSSLLLPTFSCLNFHDAGTRRQTGKRWLHTTGVCPATEPGTLFVVQALTKNSP